MDYLVGSAKTDITYFKEGLGMLGYGRPFHRMKGVETPIHARAIVVEHGGRKIAFVNAEIGFCTIYLKYGIIQRLLNEFAHLGFNDQNVMVTAQHTHSAAGGICQHFFYNVPTPGFRRDVWETYRDGIVESIVLADSRKRLAALKYGSGDFDENQEVAFNRSLPAYNANPEIRKKLSKKEWHLACDREMKLLQFEDAEGKIIAQCNWFGTHCTSISNDKRKICADNKGYAAEYAEKQLQHRQADEEAVSIFAQDACGDVTPNYVFDWGKQWTRGKFKDDYESAKYVGDLQADKADKISKYLGNKRDTHPVVDYIQTYVDFSDIECDPAYTDNKKWCRTSEPCLGVSFLEGTKEGPGMAKALGNLLRRGIDIHRRKEIKQALKENDRDILVKYQAQYPKHIAVEAESGKMGWHKDLQKIPIPGFLERSIEYIKDAEKKGDTDHKPWVISTLPLQIFRIGDIAIIGLPTEVTTVAGRRIRKSLMQILRGQGIHQAILSPYANAYAGYVTTPEEYMLQRYEGGHTLFGRWTLPAMQTTLDKLAISLGQQEQDHSQPVIFDEEKIWVYSH
jgi:neutral ceramidase